MSNDVFANGREISCKAGAGKTICAFPDVCMTPPENPATPPGVPVPYPNTGMASDTTDGSKTVNISGKEIMLKNKSYFKKSTGDEAGCAAKKGVVTSVHRGKVYFIAWSMDVKAEGENVVRHVDLTTHNHPSPFPNTGPFPHVDTSTFASLAECEGDKRKMKSACKGKVRCPGVLNTPVKKQRKEVKKRNLSADFKPHAAEMAKHDSRTAKAAAAAEAEADGSDCVKKSRCYLRPYDPKKGEDGCCPGQTPHHIPPKACFKKRGGYQAGYSPSSAMCVCLEGANQHVGSHGKNHAAIEELAKQRKIKRGDPCDVKKYNSMCAATIAVQCGCSKDCIEAQLNDSLKNQKTCNHTDTNSSAPVDNAEMKKMLKEAPVNIKRTR